MQRLCEMMRKNSNEFAQKHQNFGFLYRDYEGEDFTKTHYMCLERGLDSLPTLFVDCYSRDGRWVVSLIGLKRTRSEFETILSRVVSMGNPTK
jgi:hypothetical protein